MNNKSIIAVPKLNLRNSAGGRIITTLKQGTEVEVLDTDGGWSKVALNGWVSNDYLREKQPDTNSGRIIKRIVIHCSATKGSQNPTADDIKLWHTGPKSQGHRGWNKAGYHWVIERKPFKVVPLVPLGNNEWLSSSEISNGARGYNSDSIHVCYVGGLNERGKAENNITKEQTKALIDLLDLLVERRPRIENIVGHNDLNPMKACPSFDVADFLHKNCAPAFAKKYALP